jgi:hypothetical protein
MPRVLVVVLCALLATLGCRKLVKRAVQKATEDKPAQVGNDKADPQEKTLEAAMSMYAEGYNKMIGPVRHMMEDYERAVPEVKGPPARKPILVAGLADRDLDEVAKAFGKAKEATPAPHAELGKLADDALAAARGVRKEFLEAVRYYGAENYKDDKGAGGQAIHTRMTDGVAAYEAAVGKLQARLSEIELDMQEKELKQVPETKAGHHFRAFNLAAKRLLDSRSAPDKLDAALLAVRAAQAKLKAFADAHADTPTAFKNYVNLADQFETQATAYVREAKAPSKGKPGRSTNASLLVSRYNTIVQVGNSLYQLEGSGILK